jgi:hypothetical protein
MEKKLYFTIIPTSAVDEVLKNGITTKNGILNVFLFSKIADEVKDEFVNENVSWSLLGIDHEGIQGSILNDDYAKTKKIYRFIIEQNYFHPRFLTIYHE